MKNFSEFYKEITSPAPYLPPMPLFGLKEIVSYGGFRWEVTAFEPNEEEGCWMYDLKRVDGTDKEESSIHELGITKSFIVEKPGNSTHTPKWDRCVAQVENMSEGANAYAVCTAMLGDESFKAMDDDSFDEKVKMYMQKLGIAGAGPIPNSLLAEQDLEGARKFDGGGYETTEKSQDIQSFAVWYYDESGARKCAVFNNVVDAEAYAGIVDAMGYKDIKIVKGQMEQTQKELDTAAKEAEEAGEDEVKSLVNRIKNIQIKRQSATINQRGAESQKSFKQKWTEISRS